MEFGLLTSKSFVHLQVTSILTNFQHKTSFALFIFTNHMHLFPLTMIVEWSTIITPGTGHFRRSPQWRRDSHCRVSINGVLIDINLVVLPFGDTLLLWLQALWRRQRTGYEDPPSCQWTYEKVWELVVHWSPPLITGPSRRSQKTVNRCYCTPLIKLNQIINQLTTRNQLGVQETGERLIDLQTCWSQKINTSSSASETENVPSVAIRSRYLIIVILGELRLTAQRD